MGNKYPGEYPLISASSRESILDPLQMLHFESCLQEYCKKLPLGEPMLMDLCNEAILRVNEFVTPIDRKDSNLSAKIDEDETEETFICIIQLEHMRDKRNYIKTIKTWSNELGIHGAIIFYGKLKVLIILLGTEVSIKSFNHNLKTQNVDIDSRGRQCKEKLSKMLCCEALSQSTASEIINEFKRKNESQQSALCILDAKNIDEVKTYFYVLKLQNLFIKYIGFEK